METKWKGLNLDLDASISTIPLRVRWVFGLFVVEILVKRPIILDPHGSLRTPEYGGLYRHVVQDQADG